MWHQRTILQHNYQKHFLITRDIYTILLAPSRGIEEVRMKLCAISGSYAEAHFFFFFFLLPFRSMVFPQTWVMRWLPSLWSVSHPFAAVWGLEESVGHQVTSTEEYPHLKPARFRRGFVHSGISVRTPLMGKVKIKSGRNWQNGIWK